MEKIKVNVENLKWINEKIGTYNKKAKKLNVNPIIITESNHREEFVKKCNGISSFVKFCDIEISDYQELIFDNGKILCKVEHYVDEDGKNKITFLNSKAVNLFDIEYLKNLENNCEHCNTNRLRKITYIIEKNDGTIIQVGKSCMKEYTSIYNIDAILNLYDLIEDIRRQIIEYGYHGENFISRYNIIDVLYMVENHVEKKGYISGAEAFKIGCKSTAEKIKEEIYEYGIKVCNDAEKITQYKGYIEFYKNFDFMKYMYNDKNRKYKNCCEDEIREIFFNSFHFKLWQILNNENCIMQDIGCLTAFFITTKVLNDIKEKHDNKKSDADYEYYGEIKEKINIEAKFMKVLEFENSYSYTPTINYLYMFTNGKNYFVWSTAKFIELKENQIVKLSGTIKGYKEFNNIKQTLITRCKIA